MTVAVFKIKKKKKKKKYDQKKKKKKTHTKKKRVAAVGLDSEEDHLTQSAHVVCGSLIEQRIELHRPVINLENKI